MTIALQVQDATLRAFLQDKGGLVRGIGFLARCPISQPVSTQGSRAFREAPEQWPAISAFNDRVTAILGQPVPIC